MLTGIAVTVWLLSVATFVWVIYQLNKKVDIAIKLFVEKPKVNPKARSVSFFNPNLREKKKPKVHDDEHEWAVENDAI